MKKRTIKPTRLIKRNESYEGISIEQQMRRIKEGENIEMYNKPEIFTNRADGVLPQYDVRTDRFDIMQGAMDQLARTTSAKRAEIDAQKLGEKRSQETTGTGSEPIQA